MHCRDGDVCIGRLMATWVSLVARRGQLKSQKGSVPWYRTYHQASCLSGTNT